MNNIRVDLVSKDLDFYALFLKQTKNTIVIVSQFWKYFRNLLIKYFILI